MSASWFSRTMRAPSAAVARCRGSVFRSRTHRGPAAVRVVADRNAGEAGVGDPGCRPPYSGTSTTGTSCPRWTTWPVRASSVARHRRAVVLPDGERFGLQRARQRQRAGAIVRHRARPGAEASTTRPAAAGGSVPRSRRTVCSKLPASPVKNVQDGRRGDRAGRSWPGPTRARASSPGCGRAPRCASPRTSGRRSDVLRVDREPARAHEPAQAGLRASEQGVEVGGHGGRRRCGRQLCMRPRPRLLDRRQLVQRGNLEHRQPARRSGSRSSGDVPSLLNGTTTSAIHGRSRSPAAASGVTSTAAPAGRARPAGTASVSTLCAPGGGSLRSTIDGSRPTASPGPMTRMGTSAACTVVHGGRGRERERLVEAERGQRVSAAPCRRSAASARAPDGRRR